ncbi:tripartite motif-containing protein 2-like [Asterias rubens]|uniref:tripartite motif-containing protein 2-like n=1 Tax=Asterias rubens TaxID=7604 RepID=UPI0014555852|nr:tripartite motif-containing protein 2-like [Asterias rubens]
MSEVTVEVLLDKISRDHLKCSICLDTFQDPRLLRCNHTFCRSCIVNLLHNEQINCPMCRRTTSMRKKTPHQLSRNFRLASLVDDVEKEKKCFQERDEVLMFTMFTESTNEQKSDLGTAHTSHLVNVMNQEEKVPQCDQHQNLNLSFYCKTCRFMICAMCAAIDHRGKEHDYVPIDEAESAARDQLLEVLSKCEERHQEVIVERSLIDGERYMVVNMIFNTIRSLKETKLHQICEVTHHLQQFEQARELDYNDVLSTADAIIDWINHVSTKLSNAATEANKYHLLKQMEHLITTAETVINKTLTFPKLVSAKICICRSDTSAQVIIKKKDSCTDGFGRDFKGLLYDIKVLGYK